jgi:hypothetical protein
MAATAGGAWEIAPRRMPNNAAMLPSSLARPILRPLRERVALASPAAQAGRSTASEPAVLPALCAPACGIRVGRIAPRGRQIARVLVGRSMPCAPRDRPAP